MYVCLAVRVVTDRHTDTQTDDVKTITPVADVGCKNRKMDGGYQVYYLSATWSIIGTIKSKTASECA